MPQPNVFPALRYADAHRAIDCLVDAFGFVRHAVHLGPDGSVGHAELRCGTGVVMLGSAGAPDLANPWSATAAGVYVALADPDAHHARATAAGAEIVRPLEDTSYGAREYSARDCEGRLWSFGTYNPSPQGAADVFPGLRYADASRALAWLERAFGFSRHLEITGPAGTVVHAELALGPGFVMVGSETDGSPAGSRQGTCVALGARAAVDAHHAHAVSAGATVLAPPADTDYGARGYSALDCEEHLWTFSTYRPAPSRATAQSAR